MVTHDSTFFVISVVGNIMSDKELLLGKKKCKKNQGNDKKTSKIDQSDANLSTICKRFKKLKPNFFSKSKTFEWAIHDSVSAFI